MKIACFVVILHATMLSAPVMARIPNWALDKKRLPPRWSSENVTLGSNEQRLAIGKRLGVRITWLENVTFTVPGGTVKVNSMECTDAAAAAKAEAALLAVHGNSRAFVRRRGVEVVEVVTSAPLLAEKVLSLRDWMTPVEWKVAFTAVPVTRIKDGMACQPLFELLLKAGPDGIPDGGESARLTRKFVFADSLTLPATAQPWQIVPPPSGSTPCGAAMTFSFDGGIPKVAGIPRVKVSGVLKVTPFAATEASPLTPQDTKLLTSSTAWWPVADPTIERLAFPLTIHPPRERLERIFEMLPSKVRYGGEVKGSRHGVTAALKQGYGHCWDQSDVFVTLCRAAGLPARQVGGWIVGSSGHIWAEVYLDDEGWWSVDQGAGFTGTGESYLTLWRSSTGDPPFLLGSLVEALPTESSPPPR